MISQQPNGHIYGCNISTTTALFGLINWHGVSKVMMMIMLMLMTGNDGRKWPWVVKVKDRSNGDTSGSMFGNTENYYWQAWKGSGSHILSILIISREKDKVFFWISKWLLLQQQTDICSLVAKIPMSSVSSEASMKRKEFILFRKTFTTQVCSHNDSAQQQNSQLLLFPLSPSCPPHIPWKTLTATILHLYFSATFLCIIAGKILWKNCFLCIMAREAVTIYLIWSSLHQKFDYRFSPQKTLAARSLYNKNLQGLRFSPEHRYGAFTHVPWGPYNVPPVQTTGQDILAIHGESTVEKVGVKVVKVLKTGRSSGLLKWVGIRRSENKGRKRRWKDRILMHITIMAANSYTYRKEAAAAARRAQGKQ